MIKYTHICFNTVERCIPTGEFTCFKCKRKRMKITTILRKRKNI